MEQVASLLPDFAVGAAAWHAAADYLQSSSAAVHETGRANWTGLCLVQMVRIAGVGFEIELQRRWVKEQTWLCLPWNRGVLWKEAAFGVTLPMPGENQASIQFLWLDSPIVNAALVYCSGFADQCLC